MQFLRDLRHGWRALRQAPWYALTTVGVLSVGIGLTTVAFAVVDGVLFKPLPFARAGELYLVRADVSTSPHLLPPAVSRRDVNAWKHASPDLAITVIGNTSRSRGASIDDHFFEITGTRPLFGGFSAADFEWAGTAERTGQRITPVLLTYRYWLKEFGGDPGVVGRTIIRTKREAFVSGIRIAGVLPDGFVFPLDVGEPQPDMLTPLPRDRHESSARELHVIARVARTGEPIVVAERLRAASRSLPEAPPPRGHSPGALLQRVPFDEVQLIPLVDHLARHERPAFVLVLAASGVLLLLACVNVAGLVAARNIERRRDLAIRTALGATPWALTRALLAELALPAFVAAGLALLVAKPLLVWTVNLLPPTVILLKDPAIDHRVFVAALLLTLATCALVAVWPARLAARLGTTGRFDGAEATATRPVRRFAQPLVATQVALGFVLQTGGGLTVSSLAAAWQTDPGYRRDRMVLLELFVNEAASRRETFEKLEALPALLQTVDGVGAVAISTIRPFFSQRANVWTDVLPEGWTGDIAGVSSRQVSSNYFDVMGLRLVDGRWPSAGEWNEGRVAIVSQGAARMLWPDRNPLGRRLLPRQKPGAAPMTVIAVVADARYVALDADPMGDVYLRGVLEPGRYGGFFHVRTTAPADAVLQSILGALAGRGYLIVQASTHEDALFASVKHRALPAWLFGSLGLGALVVLGTGVFGLLAMSAAQRTREVGIRVALGASRGRVVRLLVREQALAVGLGLGAGALVSLWAVRLLESQLYGVRAHDPLVWASVASTLAAIAVIATLFPAFRAARADAAQALRAE
jgi:predicted permease